MSEGKAFHSRTDEYMSQQPPVNDRSSGSNPLNPVTPEPLEAEFSAEERLLDARLTALANRIDPPSGMADRIFAATVRDLPLTMPTGGGDVLRIVGTERARQNRMRLTPLRAVAMAASVAVVAMAGFWQFGGGDTPDGSPALPVVADGGFTSDPGIDSSLPRALPPAPAVVSTSLALNADAERELFVGTDDDSSLDLLLATRDATFDELSGELAMAVIEMEWNGFEATASGGHGR